MSFCVLLSRVILDPSRVPGAGTRWHLRPARVTAGAPGAGEAPSSSSSSCSGSSCQRAGRFMTLRTEEKTSSPVLSREGLLGPIKAAFGTRQPAAPDCPCSVLIRSIDQADQVDQVCLPRALLLLLCGNNHPSFLLSTRATPDYGNTGGGGGGRCARGCACGQLTD